MSLPIFTSLPAELAEPLYYLGSQQQTVIQRHIPLLHPYIAYLPCWVPHSLIAQALGFSQEGIQNALRWNNGKPYLWATEFENVHQLWNFEEPSFEVDGVFYKGSEDFYQRQKPFPFAASEWDHRRDDVMRIALKYKFQNSISFQQLLMSTQTHPLLSLKGDDYWGVTSQGYGENRLAELLMELRQSK